MKQIPQRVLDRFWDGVEIGGFFGCWPHRLAPQVTGYSQVGWSDGGKVTMEYGHRIAWLLAHGPIPGDLTIDHVCLNRRCVNPSHLRLLTRAENGRLAEKRSKHRRVNGRFA